MCKLEVGKDNKLKHPSTFKPYPPQNKKNVKLPFCKFSASIEAEARFAQVSGSSGISLR